MLKTLCFCLFVALTNISALSRNDFSITNKGWRPLTYEEVLFRHQKPKEKLQTFWPPRNPHNDVIKLVHPQVFTEFTIDNDASHPAKTIQAIQPTIGLPDAINNCGTKDNIFNCKKELNSESIEDLTDFSNEIIKEPFIVFKSLRKAKKIKDDYLANNIKRTFLKVKNEPNAKDLKENSESKEQELITAETDIYKVTEDENKDENIKTATVRTGYVYENPNIREAKEKNNNISEIFLKLLAKYNINSNDQLDNYKISRKPRTEIDAKIPFLYLPLPILNDKNRFYDLNQLLAVFLSKYGYYLPGYYGPSNKYRNLYGYLAANNIHNNMPFGLYKVFADTDSSN